VHHSGLVNKLATGTHVCNLLRAGASPTVVAVAISKTAQHAVVEPPPCCKETFAVVGSTATSEGIKVGVAAAGRYTSLVVGSHGPHSPTRSHSSHVICTTTSTGHAGTSTVTLVAAGAFVAVVWPVTGVTLVSIASQTFPEPDPV
tara:strand:+ start:2499 stop:2933 length:435 start_codon:yes stop_codon:yes gene_type:complete